MVGNGDEWRLVSVSGGSRCRCCGGRRTGSAALAALVAAFQRCRCSSGKARHPWAICSAMLGARRRVSLVSVLVLVLVLVLAGACVPSFSVWGSEPVLIVLRGMDWD